MNKANLILIGPLRFLFSIETHIYISIDIILYSNLKPLRDILGIFLYIYIHSYNKRKQYFFKYIYIYIYIYAHLRQIYSFLPYLY